MTIPWGLLNKLKYPALALPTTGMGIGICTLCHGRESAKIKEKNEEIKKAQSRYYGSENRRKQQKEEFIADKLKAGGVTKYSLDSIYAQLKTYKNCVKEGFEEIRNKSKTTIFSNYYWTQEHLKQKCKEPQKP